MIENGSMITIDYTAKIQNENGGTVFDTTVEDVAQTEAIFNPNKFYEPMLVVLGQGWVPNGLEKAISQSKIGEKFEINVLCDDAYGPKDPSKIKLVARREFQKQNINPSIGDRIKIGTQTGTVISVGSGRVRMDYNHVLAGKDIEYKVTIHQLITAKEDQIKALIKRRLPGADLSGISITINSSEVEVHMPEKARFLEFVQFAKAEAAKDIQEIVPGYKVIKFIETFNM